MILTTILRYEYEEKCFRCFQGKNGGKGKGNHIAEGLTTQRPPRNTLPTGGS